MEIYDFADAFQRHKYFAEEDVQAKLRLLRLENAARRETLAPNEVLPEPYVPRYENRYGSWRQDTRFFRNFCKIDDMRARAGSYAELLVECAASGVPRRALDFVMLLTFFARRRVFAVLPAASGAGVVGLQPGDLGYPEWEGFKAMLADAFRGRRHDCMTYAEFVERDL